VKRLGFEMSRSSHNISAIKKNCSRKNPKFGRLKTASKNLLPEAFKDYFKV
jgi:hypothetical protein